MKDISKSETEVEMIKLKIVEKEREIKSFQDN